MRACSEGGREYGEEPAPELRRRLRDAMHHGFASDNTLGTVEMFVSMLLEVSGERIISETASCPRELRLGKGDLRRRIEKSLPLVEG